MMHKIELRLSKQIVRLVLTGLSVLALLIPCIAMAGYVGSDIAVSDKNYDQQNPHTIYLPDKNLWFVVWEDWRNFTGTGADIYGQFINGDDGSFCGSEFVITSASGNQTVPRASYRMTGSRIVTVWQDTRGNGSGGYVYYSSITVIPDINDCGSYVPPASSPGTQIGFNGTNRWAFTPFAQIPLSQNIGTGDGTNAGPFISFLVPPVVPGSVTVTAGAQTITDNGAGGLTGDGSGTINYNSGALVVSFTTAPPASTAITVDYSYQVYSLEEVSRGDTLLSRKSPRIHYDLTRDIFWVAWTESRSIINNISEVCFGLAVANWQFGDASFPGYVKLDGATLAELDSETPPTVLTDPPPITGADIIRNHATRTNRLITSSHAALTETYEYEFFTNANNLDAASDTTSPEAFLIWEGERRKGVLTCLCKDNNENEVCDSADTITSTFATSNYDDGLVHIYGLFDKEIHNTVIFSKRLDTGNTAAGYYPSIGFDPVSKRFLAAWEDLRNGLNTKIFGQLIYSGSGLYNQNFLISYQDTDFDNTQDPNVANSKQTKPFVSYDPVNQRFFVIWQDGRNGGLENLDIFGQKVDAEGSLRGNNFAIFTEPFNQFIPTIAYNDVTNQFLSVWKDARNADNSTCSVSGGVGTGIRPCGSDVYAQRFTLGQPALTLLNMDNTALTPVILMNFENPPGSGSVDVGLFASRSFKVRNTGDVTLKIDYIDMTCGGLFTDIDPFSFDGFDSKLAVRNDGLTLDLVPGAENIFTVRFTPLNGGTYNKCFIIESDGGNPRVNLSALAVESNITVDPAAHNFGSIYIGSFGEKTFVVRNTGTAALVIASLNSPSTPFTIQSDGCSGKSIAPGSTCNVVARFTPASTGPFSSSFSLNSNDPDTPSLSVALNGTGLGAQDITVNPLAIDFGDVQVGQNSQQVISVKNDGTASLSITSVSSPPPPFSLVGNTCPATLAVGQSCTITVQFAPTTSGTTSSNLDIVSNDPDEGTVTVGLKGNGVITPDISVSPTFKNFPSTIVGSTAQQIFDVRNIGTKQLIISSLANPSGEFSIVSSNCIGVILPSQSCAITLEFKPASAGFKQSSFAITSDDPDTPVLTVLLSGTGSTGAVASGKIRLSSLLIDFNDVHVGSNAFRILTVINDGASDLTVTSVSSPSTPFRIEQDDCSGKMVTAAATCKIRVAFNPTFIGAFNPYFITVTSTDPNNPSMKVTLKGNGISEEQLIFADVPSTYWSFNQIEGIYNFGITVGCSFDGSTRLYCPNTFVTRAGMAVFIIKAMGEIPSSAAYNAYFDDIANDGFAGYINRMLELSITSGCGARAYCPSSNVTRGEMAVFIVRAMGETPSSVAYNAYFDDIANDGFAGYINRMKELSITSGCGVRAYCPSTPIGRDEMAVFLFKAFIDIPGLLY